MKPRLSFSALSILSITLGGFAACTFGADDFKIVKGSTSSGGDGSGDMTSTAGENPGGNSAGGTTNNGGQSQGGANAGETSVGGEAGAGGATPHYVCVPQADAFTVMGPADHGLTMIQDVELANGLTGLVVIAAGPNMASGGQRLAYRSLSDSGGGMPTGQGKIDTMGNRILIAASTVTVKRELKIMGVDDAGLFEYSTAMPVNGQPFVPAIRRDIPGAEQCTASNMNVRDVHGDYGPTGLGFAFTCNDPMDTQFQLFVSDPSMAGMPPQLVQANLGDTSAIVRRFVRTNGRNFLFVGDEVGPRIGVRYGVDVQALSTLHTISLSSDPNVWSALNAKLFPTGLLIAGAAFTTDGPNTPPYVPASLYAGIVDDAGIDNLFRAAPPSNLHQVVTFTKASQLVGFEDTFPLGKSILGVGIPFTAKDRISAALVSADGQILAEPTQIYQSTGGISILQHTLHVAPLGPDAVMVWGEGSEVKARTFTCLPD